jgi:DNA-binding GntR family transcriptional regulator
MAGSKAVIPENKLDNQSLSGKAADFLRQQIIQGIFEQGSRLGEEDLAVSLAVSRACIREALQMLETEGLVRRIRNRHTEIVHFDRQDIEEVFLLRAALESLCAETCISRGTVPIRELETQLTAIEGATKLERKNAMERVVEDLRFHEIFVLASGNERAIAFWKSIRSQMLTMFYAIPLRYAERFDRHNTESHVRIIQGLKAGDASGIATVLRDHILNTMQLLMNLEPPE